jgi:hypothetical protein|tara:strand:+ start:3694 stop:4119 length:426 start_codon:yes stop_codon:yes gene_type:complete
MKLGRFIPLGNYRDVKIGYGTINHRDLKTIYLKLNSWLEPQDSDINYDSIVKLSRTKVRKLIYNLGFDIFRPESIVDLDIRTKGISKEKRSFMDLEITLYVLKDINIKSEQLKQDINSLVREIVDTCLNDELLFNFNKKKK